MKVYIVIENPGKYTVDNSYRKERNEHPLGNIIGVYTDKLKADAKLMELFEDADDMWKDNDGLQSQWFAANNVWEFNIIE